MTKEPAKKDRECSCPGLAANSGKDDVAPESAQNHGALTILWGPRGVFSEGGDIYYCVCEACRRRWQVCRQQPDHCPQTFHYWHEVTGKPEFDAFFAGWPPAR